MRFSVFLKNVHKAEFGEAHQDWGDHLENVKKFRKKTEDRRSPFRPPPLFDGFTFKPYPVL